MKLAEILSDSHLKYDPVNVGTYNYSAYDFDYVNLDGSKKKTSFSKHNDFDVYPYLGNCSGDKKKDYKNFGNVPDMIYRNTKDDRDNNKDIYEDVILNLSDGKDRIYTYWELIINAK